MISIENPESLLKDCKLMISPIIGIKGLGFNRPRRAPATRSIWELNGHYQSQAETRRQVHKVIPFLRTPSHVYWLSTQLAFEFVEGQYLLKWISLTVFEGERRDDFKKALLRAEWSLEDSSQRVGHAQPHWHVYSSWPAEIEDSALASLVISSNTLLDQGDIDPEIPPLAPPWSQGEKFHFAMASRWHSEGSQAHSEEFERETLLNWIDGCLRYVINQLSYLDGAAP